VIPALRIKVGLGRQTFDERLLHTSPTCPPCRRRRPKNLDAEVIQLFSCSLSLSYDGQSFKFEETLWSYWMGGGSRRYDSIEDGPAASGDACLDIAAAVANHVAARQIMSNRRRPVAAFPVLASCNRNHRRLSWKQTKTRSIAGSSRAITSLMSSTVFFRRCSTCTSGWLVTTIRTKPRILQTLRLLAQSGIDFDILDPRRRVRLALSDHRVIEHTVHDQERSPSIHLAGLAVPTADSHFVWLAFNFGCETSRCRPPPEMLRNAA